MSNSKNVLNKNYVSLEKYNKIKYDLYLKDNEIERLEGEIYNRDIIIQDLYNKIIYWGEEYQKVSKNQNVNNQYKYDFANFKQMYIEFTKEKNNEIQNKDNIIKEQKEELKENKDNEIQRLKDEKEELKQRLEKENKELKDINTKLKNNIYNNIRLLFNYKEGDKIDKNFINILLDMIFDNNTNNNLIENNKDGE